MLTSSALDADGSSDRGLLVDYASMPGALEAYVFPKHFGLSLAPEDALRTHAASSGYSKARGGRKAGNKPPGKARRQNMGAAAARAAPAAGRARPQTAQASTVAPQTPRGAGKGSGKQEKGNTACRFWEANRKCKYGDRCRFAHE